MDDHGTATVLVARNADHHLVVLNRPAERNSLLPSTILEIEEALTEAERSSGCRAFVLTGTGNEFCSGADVESAIHPEPWLDGLDARCWRLMTRISDSPLVTIAAVQGPATGAGVGLAASCDLVIAHPAASFRLTEVLIYLQPALMWPFIANRIGETETVRMSLLTEHVDARRALRTGLCDRVEPQIDSAHLRILTRLHGVDQFAIKQLKVLSQAMRLHRAESGLHAGRLMSERLQAPDFLRRVRHFQREGLL
jgi:polyketide biosynthesis enoyl-CoA hydratase PksH